VLELSHTDSGQITEERTTISNFGFSDNSDEVYAIDNDFIKVRPEDFLSDKVKVFARISPENKALIVRRHREREQAILKERKGLARLLGDCSFKVGMVGDGANDLIAIKEADVGMGISSSDAVYSASFAIGELSQIIQIVLESKNTERQINEMAKYYGITQFLSIVNTVILTEDCAYFTSLELIYKNFINTLLITVCFCMCRPSRKLSKPIPNSNFLDLENHLVFWGNLLICTVGLVVAYIQYASSADFVPN
jgi:magnesium-transporting ATPase (P-type)